MKVQTRFVPKDWRVFAIPTQWAPLFGDLYFVSKWVWIKDLTIVKLIFTLFIILWIYVHCTYLINKWRHDFANKNNFFQRFSALYRPRQHYHFELAGNSLTQDFEPVKNYLLFTRSKNQVETRVKEWNSATLLTYLSVLRILSLFWSWIFLFVFPYSFFNPLSWKRSLDEI